jgi:hypothetical protein
VSFCGKSPQQTLTGVEVCGYSPNFHKRTFIVRIADQVPQNWGNLMYTLGALLLSALLLGAVISVIESVLQLVGAHGAISKLPLIGAHLSLIIAIGMVWLLKMNPIAGWGVSFSDEWMTYVANGAIILGMIPLKDAVINMVNKGLRA